ncbi:MAG TPA: ABC transporter permease [Pyrinomonadaceae bacterium]|jgi:putative ABC transport system permease protein|nr:ABC transporter permease [Pyrinomonadaceae bacterium]
MTGRYWRPYLWLIAAVSLLVPRRFRAVWKQEWEAELRHREVLLQKWQKLDLRGRFDLLRRSSGSFRDALWLQPKRLEEDMFQDLRYGLRMLLKKPGFTITAVLALAIGIGANTAIFSVVNAVLLRPLPFTEPERLTMIWLRGPEGAGGDRVPLSVADFLDWRAQNQVFEKVAAYGTNLYNYTGGETPEQVRGVNATAEFFSILGAKPALGRTFLPDEDRADAAPVVVISHGFWQKRLGSDPQAVGRTITLNDKAYTIIGVMPASFDFPQRERELWTAFPLQPPKRRGPYFLRGLARLKPGVTIEGARAAMNLVGDPSQGPKPDAGDRFTVLPLNEYIVGDVRPALLVLFGAVALVLLIATANVANLLLARASEREKEISIRAALGATRARILRQLLTESVLLAAIGGLLGSLLAYWGVDLLLALSPGDIPRLHGVRIDWQVLAWTIATSLASGIIFGLVPALQGSRSNLNEALKEGGRSSTESFGKRRLRGAFVVFEVALALMLLASAGLLIKSFVRLREVNPGFNAERILTMEIPLPRARYSESQQRAAFFQQLLERVKTVPGVQAVAVNSSLPPDQLTVSDNFSLEGQAVSSTGELPAGSLLTVSPDYFRALGIPLLRGRTFADTDTAEATPVAIISDTMARQYFAGQDPIGKRFRQGGPKENNPFMEIVGVVGDVKYEGLETKMQPAFYEPLLQAPWGQMYMVVQSSTSDPLSLAPAIRREVAALNPDVPVAGINTMDQLLSRSVAQPRFRTLLVAIFSAMALLLAAIGIYGVMSYSVTQRTHEIGLRMALGAQRSDVLRMVVGQGMILTLVGIATGLVAAFLVTRFMESLLYGVTATDPVTFAAVSLVLSAVALLATFIPARRATRVDPMIALRNE